MVKVFQGSSRVLNTPSQHFFEDLIEDLHKNPQPRPLSLRKLLSVAYHYM